jgi:hypothetical protein
MRNFVLPALLLAVALSGCSRKSEEKPAPTTNTTENATGNPLTAPVDYLGAVNQAQKHSVKVIDTVQINNAIRQFHAVENRYPKDLNELVTSGYLVRLPRAPRGSRIVYDPTTGQVRVVRQQ